MSKLCVAAFSLSLDGFGAGPAQDLANPMGLGGMALHQWVFGTKTFQQLQLIEPTPAGPPPREDVDDRFAARSFENLGAWIMGRNMFGPVRGPWPDDEWKGWWGKVPPYHVPVFVLTHHARPSLSMEGGTTFHFVTDGIHAAYSRAREAAKGKDIRLGGGVATVREYVTAGLVDELHLAISPALLGRGEHLFAGIDLVKLGYGVAEQAASARALHVVLRK
jgi:dihydrofolate reductase